MTLKEHAAASKHSPATLGKIADLLKRSGIEPEDVGKVDRVRLNEWQGMYKDDDGEAHVVDMSGASVVLSPKWAEGPAWPPVQPAPTTVVRTPKLAPKSDTGLRTAVVLPDMQIGYYRDARDQLHPTHDEAALDVALQVTRAARPDVVVMVGDNLDLPELSRYRKTPTFARTTQATIDRAGQMAAQVRAAAPDAAIEWLAGNHEERLPNYIIDNAAAAYGIRQANVPDSWPVLSVPHLVRLEEHGITYHPGYPANKVWLSDRLQVIHGDKVSSSGSTAHRYLDSERVSTIFGHVHRREWAERTRHTQRGPRTILAATPGCLCRIDGKVPSTKSGHDLDGIPLTRWEDWQQGLAVVYFTPGDGPFVYEPVAIHDGRALWHGRDFSHAA